MSTYVKSYMYCTPSQYVSCWSAQLVIKCILVRVLNSVDLDEMARLKPDP